VTHHQMILWSLFNCLRVQKECACIVRFPWCVYDSLRRNLHTTRWATLDIVVANPLVPLLVPVPLLCSHPLGHICNSSLLLEHAWCFGKSWPMPASPQRSVVAAIAHFHGYVHAWLMWYTLRRDGQRRDARRRYARCRQLRDTSALAVSTQNWEPVIRYAEATHATSG
jgi:hypothetical protein